MPPKPKFTTLDDALYEYLVEHRSPDDDVLRELREETARLGSHAVMQIAPDQASFLRILVAAIGARRAIEVGTFTGFSALAIARGLPRDGHLLCLDVSEEWTSVARRAWARAGLDGRIELRIGPAAESLRALPDEPTFDFAFIDADKKGYPVYWQEIVRRLRPWGLIAVDNVLWEGEVVRPEEQGEDVVAIRRFNELVLADRIELRIAPAAETLRALPDEPQFDFAFIDADKTGYPVYWEEIVRRLRPGGLIAVDNVLWGGDVVRPEEQDDDVLAMRRFNVHRRYPPDT